MMPDGQIGFRSSVRTRRSTRHHHDHHQHGEARAGDSGAGGHRLQETVVETEPTIDIQIPNIGRLQVPIDASRGGTAEVTHQRLPGITEHQRNASERRPRRLTSMATKQTGDFARRRSRSQSLTPPPDRNDPDSARYQGPAKTRKSKFSTAEVSNLT